ncbi:GAF domain-containing protein [Microbacterium enclense]|uniref:sensor histidine kinase n=1 Tax=Microbacterium enclense TaxID=993073 RepID=UPI0021A5C87E|nr:GAF domain-containing sensor histidine kinase [Microbacterium enclense]MCT2085239.1 GAF domain-containing protein [Microbacterium enclense]
MPSQDRVAPGAEARCGAVGPSSSQDRLRGLLRAVETVVGEIELPVVLRRVVEAAVDLVDAEYGALGIIAADRISLDQFIHVGLDAEAADAIGHLPRGRGILGALIAHPQPIRLGHLGEDPRAAGFPAHHPRMDSFLGAPVRVRGEVFGNLYLTNARRGSFTAEDEELVRALASTAGFAIQNARLFDEARTRAAWMTATAELSAAILSTPLDNILDLLAGRVADLAPGSRVSVLVPIDDSPVLRVAAARGPGEDEILGTTAGGTGGVSGSAMESGGVRLGTVARTPGPRDPALLTTDDEEGPVIAVPLRTRQRTWGALSVARAPGERGFSPVELEVLGDLASQASIAWELSRARGEQQRAILNDERARIARDLHDHVIQQIFGAGLTLQSLAAALPDTGDRHRMDEVIRQLDDAIAQIRTVVFALSARDGGSLRHRLIDVVAEASGALRRPPALRFSGPVDSTVRGPLADDVVGVARELLTNSVRHADANTISLDVGIGRNDVWVVVADDGTGIRDPRRSGLANLADRAEARGGALTIETGTGGTRAEWRVPLAAEGEAR